MNPSTTIDLASFIDGDLHEDVISVFRCVGCEAHLTADTIRTKQGAFECPLCGTMFSVAAGAEYELISDSPTAKEE